MSDRSQRLECCHIPDNLAHGDIVPLLGESLGRQPVSQDQVVHVNPVHPGLRVTEPEKEEAALHVPLERQRQDTVGASHGDLSLIDSADL